MWRNTSGTAPAGAKVRHLVLGFVLCSIVCLGHVSADQPPSARAGAAVTVSVPVPERVTGPVHFVVAPAPDVGIAEPHSGHTNARELVLRATLPTSAPAGSFLVATVTFTDAAGHQTTVASRMTVEAPGDGHTGATPRESAEDGDGAGGATSTDVRAITAAVGRLPGSVYLGVTELGTSGRSDPETGFGIDLKGQAKSDTHVKASFVRGWNPGVTAAYRYGMHASRGELEVRNTRWTFAAGELMAETTLAGVRTVADGVSYERTAGRVLGSATIAKPKYYAGGWAGHLAQGSIGLAFPGGTVMLVAADLSRPSARSSVVVSFPDSNADSEILQEDLERLGRLFSREDRLQTGGIEGRLRKGRHLLTGRAGRVELVAPSGERSRGQVGDVSYSFTSRRGAITGRLRRGPPSVPGTYMSGDSTTASGRLNVAGPVTITARGFGNESLVFGRQQPTVARGVSGGIEYAKNGANLQVDGNYRESRLVTTRISRSVTARGRWPLGPVLVDADGEYGSANDYGRADRIAAYRMALLYDAEPATLSLSGSYQDYGVLPARFGVDAGGSVEWGRAMLEGGVGVSKGQLFGDEMHAWASAEIRLPRQFTMLVGVDYDRWRFENSPFLTFVPDADDLAEPWRLTFNLQKAFWLAFPFGR